MSKKVCGVYKIENTITGDFYVGSSVNVKRRWITHRNPFRHSYCPDNKMYSDMEKYGNDCFKMELICECKEENLKEMEQYFIDNMKPTYSGSKSHISERKKEQTKKLATRLKRLGFEHPSNKYIIKG